MITDVLDNGRMGWDASGTRGSSWLTQRAAGKKTPLFLEKLPVFFTPGSLSGKGGIQKADGFRLLDDARAEENRVHFNSHGPKVEHS